MYIYMYIHKAQLSSQCNNAKSVFFRPYQDCLLKHYKKYIFCNYRRIIFASRLKTSKKICLSV